MEEKDFTLSLFASVVKYKKVKVSSQHIRRTPSCKKKKKKYCVNPLKSHSFVSEAHNVVIILI